MSTLPQSLSHADEMSLARAYRYLERPSFAARLTHLLGTPFERSLKLLPRQWHQRLHRCAEAGIGKALDVAIYGLRQKRRRGSDDRRYKALGMATGAIGGFFGTLALCVELPLTTTLMLRSIADIGRSEGEDLGSMESRLACMEVFALGGRSNLDDAADTGYYGLRLALELPVASASAFISRHGVTARGGAPALVNLVATVAERFGVVLSEKTAAEIIPVFGAAGGAFVNGVFIQHFQDMARSHFTIRRLERKYNPTLIQAAYERLKSKQQTH